MEGYSFTKKVWIVAGIFAFVAVMILLLKATFSVLLLILAGVLIAVYFRGLGHWIERRTHWRKNICLVISILVTLLLFALFIWLVGSKLQQQITELTDTLPKTIENAKRQLGQSTLGQKLVDKVSSADSQKKISAVVSTFFKSSFGVIGDIYVVVFIGIFFTASPKIYTEGIIGLIPRKGKQKAGEVLKAVGMNLKKWLKGKLFAMLVVFVLTSIGLLIIGAPMWLVLSLIAGLLNFIPNFGPLMALIPAVLVGLLQSPTTALWIAGLYIVVQVTESNFITPTVQHKLIKIPPALIIIAQLLVAPLTGGWGLILATPLMIIVQVLIKNLYSETKTNQPLHSREASGEAG